VSQPVKASNIGSACAFSGPRARAISWPAETWKDFPVLMDTHTSIFSFGVRARATARTTTSVSTVRMRIFLRAAWAACNIMRLLASSWLPGLRAELSRSGGLLKTSYLPVMASSLSASWNESGRTPERKLNSSVLFSSTMRKLAKFHYSPLVFSPLFPAWLLLYPSMNP